MSSLPNELWSDILVHAISFEDSLAMVKPTSERLHPFFPGIFSGFSDTHFYSTQLTTWKQNNTTVLKLMRVNRLWRSLVEEFLYSALYVEEEWRVEMFIDTIKENPKLAEQLRTLVVMPRSPSWGVREPSLDRLIMQVLSLCHGVVAIVMDSYVFPSPLSLLQSFGSSRRLLLLSAKRLRNEDFPTFMMNFSNYATLQVLELSVNAIQSHTPPSFPEHITFPSLHALLLGDLDPLSLSVVGRWELPSLKELSITRRSPLISTALIRLLQGSYERLEFLNVCMDLLHDRALYSITLAPPPRLTKLTLSMDWSVHSSPPMQLAAKPIYCHVVTLGISKIGMIRLEDKAVWVRFLSDPTYMPRLRSVLTDATAKFLELCLRTGSPLFDILRSLEEVLTSRGVAFKGVTSDKSSFFPIKLRQRTSLQVSMSLSFIARRLHVHQHDNAL